MHWATFGTFLLVTFNSAVFRAWRR